ncbi:MAG TPA: histidine phosphatase family protein [Candidatus Angelobacter sp.]|nr:histidine phosphatase family protein [Candidatus Angelobacter sp.]
MKRLLFLVLSTSVVFLSQPASSQQTVHTIFLVRHAETGAGPQADELSPAGAARATCLSKMLKDAGIKQIYVSDAKRTQQTAVPLARALKLTPTIIPAKDPNTLIRNLLYAPGGGILVVGNSDALPFVLARLKAGTVAPIAENEYDRMFAVTVTEGAAGPITTLRYCDCGGAPAPAAQPTPKPKKTVPKKR